MKKALIVASGLRGVVGHNFFYTQAVKEELEKRGFQVAVFVNKNAPADFIRETGFTPVFSLGTYDFIPNNGFLPDLIYLYLQSRIYAYELQAEVKKTNGVDFDLIFCHTVADFELIAWNHFLKKNNLRGKLFVMQRNTPKFLEIQKWKQIFHPYLRIRPHYLNALAHKLKDRFFLLTDSDTLTEDYKEVFRRNVVTAPIPLKGFAPQNKPFDFSPGSLLARYNLHNDNRKRFGFMGDSRNHKGFSLLPEMIQKVLEKKEREINFIIQCPNSEYDNTDMPTGLAELRELTKVYPENITLVFERLSDEDYLTLYRFLDAVMIPYTHRHFTEGTSNVFTEAVALGKPLVVSNNTWMSGELKKYEGGLEFKKGNVEDFADKIIKLAENYDFYARKALDYSPIWRSFHNAKNLVDVLLKERKIERIPDLSHAKATH